MALAIIKIRAYQTNMASSLNWLRRKSFSCPQDVSNPKQSVLPGQDQPLEQFRD